VSGSRTIFRAQAEIRALPGSPATALAGAHGGYLRVAATAADENEFREAVARELGASGLELVDLTEIDSVEAEAAPGDTLVGHLLLDGRGVALDTTTYLF